VKFLKIVHEYHKIPGRPQPGATGECRHFMGAGILFRLV